MYQIQGYTLHLVVLASSLCFAEVATGRLTNLTRKSLRFLRARSTLFHFLVTHNHFISFCQFGKNPLATKANCFSASGNYLKWRFRHPIYLIYLTKPRAAKKRAAIVKPTQLIATALIVNILLGGIAWGGNEDKAPAIVEGYGNTKWGQAIEEVAKILGVEVAEGDQSCRISGEGPAVDFRYEFFEDQLYLVRVHYEFPGKPEKGPDHNAYRTLGQMIAKKYRNDVKVRGALAKAGISIYVSRSDVGQVLVTYYNEKLERKVQKAKQDAVRKKRDEAMTSEDKTERTKIFDTLQDEL